MAQAFLKRLSSLKRFHIKILLAPTDARLQLVERFPAVCKSGAKLEMSGAKL